MSDFALSINNVSRDLEVQKYPPILTPEEEYDLAIELYENGVSLLQRSSLCLICVSLLLLLMAIKAMD
jgi:hypothetical protein